MRHFSSYPQGYATGSASSEQFHQGTVMKGGTAVSSVHGHSNASAISQLQVGDSFQGEIVSVSGEEVNLKLVNGQYLAARLEGQMQLAIGQILNFQVQTNDNAKIVLKPIYANLMQQQVGEAALKTANLAINDKTLQLVSFMLEQGMPIHKEALAMAYRQVLQHPNHNMESVLQLQRYQLPVTEENLTQYESYQNMEHKLLHGMQEAVSEMLELYTELNHVNILTNKSTNNEAMVSPSPTGEQIAQSAASASETQASSLTTANSFMEQIISIMTEDALMGTLQSNTSTVEEQALLKMNGMSEALLKEAALGKENMMNATAEQLGVALKDSLQSAILNETQEQSHLLSFAKVTAQLQGISEEQLSQKVIQFLQQETLDLPTLKLLLQTNQFTQAGNSETLKQDIFSSEAFQKLFQKHMAKEWTLTPQGIGEKDAVQKFYHKLLQQSAKLSEVINEATANTVLQPRAMQNIQQNLDFMNQMNQVFQFVQLPIKFSDKHGNGELYVFTNKKNLAKKEGTLTALLHLDMDHLGYLDINISLNLQQNQVTTIFHVQEDMMPFLLTHMEELNQRLVQKGYRVKTSVSPIAEKKAALKHIEEGLGASSSPISYQAFDVRM